MPIRDATEGADQGGPPPAYHHVQLKVGVMGGASVDIALAHLRKAEQLGAAIADAGCVVITGACSGLPLAAARGAKSRRA